MYMDTLMFMYVLYLFQYCFAYSMISHVLHYLTIYQLYSSVDIFAN